MAKHGKSKAKTKNEEFIDENASGFFNKRKTILIVLIGKLFLLC